MLEIGINGQSYDSAAEGFSNGEREAAGGGCTGLFTVTDDITALDPIYATSTSNGVAGRGIHKDRSG
eukprot:15356258-Ditylum_brightwellii.AAC.1